MSDPPVPEPWRVGVVAEGKIDKWVIEAALAAILGPDRVVVTLIQPEDSLAFGAAGQHGGGWKGVRGWCLAQAAGPGVLDALRNLDLLLVHLDGDVAREPEIGCARPCPPPTDTADALAGLVHRWLRLDAPHPRVLPVIPIDSTESWLLPVLRPDLPVTECEPDPAKRLASGKPRLVEQGGKKKTAEYQKILPLIRAGWGVIVRERALAARFQQQILSALPTQGR